MGILKNGKRFLKPIIIGTLSLTLLFGGGMALSYVSDEVVFENYADNQEQDEMVKLLDCQDVYRDKWGYRLKHNDTQPIYVSISDDFTQAQREEVVKALDYIFGIVGEINDNYRYEIVEKDFKFAKTSIHFRIKGDGDYEGIHKQNFNSFMSLLGGHGMMSYNHTISIDPQFLETQQKRTYSVCVHELLHCFGIDDVYSAKNKPYVSNTFVNVNVENKGVEMLTPNDMKLLCAMYHKPFANNEERDAFVQQVLEKVDAYSVEFYTHHDKAFQEYYQKIYEEKGYPQTTIDRLNMHLPIQNGKFTFYQISNSQKIGSIELVLDDSGYTVTTFDHNQNQLDSCSGKAYMVNNAVYLQNVNLDPLLSDANSYVDLCLYLQADGKYVLKDLTDSAVFYGTNLKLELDLSDEKE